LGADLELHMGWRDGSIATQRFTQRYIHQSFMVSLDVDVAPQPLYGTG